MADGFDDDMDGGRLVIATDEERMECSANGERGSESNTQNDLSIQTATGQTMTTSPQESANIVLKHSTTELSIRNPDSDINETERQHSPVDSSTTIQSALPDSTQKIEPMEDGELMEEEEESKQQISSHGDTNADKNSISVKWESTKIPKIDGDEPQHGVHNFFDTTPNNNGRKKKKVINVDKSTCVFAKPNGMSSLDEHLLAMRPGTNLTIDFTIICKAGGNTLYICAKWKGRDYHGVLTDGEPLYSHLCAQKRAHFSGRSAGGVGGTGGDGNGRGIGDRTIGNGKQRGGKRGGTVAMKNAETSTAGTTNGGEKRTKSSNTDLNSPDDYNNQEDTGLGQMEKNNHESQEKMAENGKMTPSTSNSAGGHSTPSQYSSHHHHQRRRRSSASSTSHSHSHGLQEVDRRSHPNRCPHRQCGFRFESIGDMNTHLLISHGTAEGKAAIFSESATQTARVETSSVGCDPIVDYSLSICAKCKQQIEGNGDIKRKRPETLEEGNVDADAAPSKKNRKGATEGNNEEEDNSPGFSDISNDAAPTLEKEDQPGNAGTNREREPLDQTHTYELGTTTMDDVDKKTILSTSSHQSIDGNNAPPNANPHLGHLTQSEAASMLFQSTTKKEPRVPEENIQSRKTSTNLAEATATFAAPFGGGGPLPIGAVSNPAMVAAAMFGPGSSNPFLQLPPQLQAFVAAQQSLASHQPQTAAAMAQFMSPPAPGLLSLGTPLASVASSNCGTSNALTATMANGPTSSAAKSDAQQPHKIYELQQLAANFAAAATQQQEQQLQNQQHNLSRAASTKPAMAVGGGSGSNISPVPKPIMRPMSAMPSSATGSGGGSLNSSSGAQNQQQKSLVATAQQQQQFLLRPSQLASAGQFFPASIAAGFPALSAAQMSLNPAAATAAALFAAQASTFPQMTPGGQTTLAAQQQMRRQAQTATTASSSATNQNAQQMAMPMVPSAAAQQAASMLPPPIGIVPHTAAGLQANYLAAVAANAGMDLGGMLQQFMDQSQPQQSHPQQQQTQK